jgi:tetrathionate reductase subunit A
MDKDKGIINTPITRREFLKVSTALATTAAVSASLLRSKSAKAITTGQNLPDPVEGASNMQIRYTVDQNCQGRCGLRCEVVDGVLVKIDGNPYHPNNLEEDERLPYDTPVSQANLKRGRLCPKGHAGIQVLYDPYRIKHPLKRVGPRGSGKWQSISWDQALTEIATAINLLIPTASRLTAPIYPGDAGLTVGPIANQLMFAPGRFVDGEIGERIFKNVYGTANFRLDHTSICEETRFVARKFATENKNDNYKPDIENSEYLIIWGENPLEANFPLVAIARKIMDFKSKGGKLVVIDPRFSNTAAKADLWVPIQPGTDAALALGMINYIISNNLYDATYLRNANQLAANAIGEKTYSDATYMVLLRSDLPGNVPSYALPRQPGRFLMAQDLNTSYGLGNTTNKVVMNGSTPVEVVSTSPITGSLDTGEIILTPSGSTPSEYIWSDGNIHCKSVFTLLKERALEKSINDYADICDVDPSVIQTLATEFTSHGKKAVAENYRGPIKHTNGIHAQFAIAALNTLIGNYSWAGGVSTGGGSWANASGVIPVKTYGITPVATKGIRIDRAGATYETNFLFNNYPAKRPWFPFASYGNYQEVVPSIADGYPYPCKVLITYWNAWPYSTPGLKTIFEQTVSDESKIPLFVSISPVMGETSVYADYILPDTTYLEKWSFPGMTPTIQTKATAFRQPVVGTFDGKPWDAPFDPNATNNYTPILPDTMMLEDILIQLMKKLGLDPGLNNAWEFIKWELTNVAYNATNDPSVPVPATVNDIIAKGGVFQSPANYIDSKGRLIYGYSGPVHLYAEPLSIYIDSMTGKIEHDPLPLYLPISDVEGNTINDVAYPFKLITFKTVLHGQARTHMLPWLMLIHPQNFIEINSIDAYKLGIKTGDRIRIISASNPSGIIGIAKVIEGIKPGVIGISHHFGHWQNGATPWIEDGTQQDYDPSRGAGITVNPIMRLDPILGNVSLQDKVGGSCAFYDTRVNIVKV